jgi:hypothetical protein
MMTPAGVGLQNGAILAEGHGIQRIIPVSKNINHPMR